MDVINVNMGKNKSVILGGEARGRDRPASRNVWPPFPRPATLSPFTFQRVKTLTAPCPDRSVETPGFLEILGNFVSDSFVWGLIIGAQFDPAAFTLIITEFRLNYVSLSAFSITLIHEAFSNYNQLN